MPLKDGRELALAVDRARIKFAQDAASSAASTTDPRVAAIAAHAAHLVELFAACLSLELAEAAS